MNKNMYLWIEWLWIISSQSILYDPNHIIFYFLTEICYNNLKSKVFLF